MKFSLLRSMCITTLLAFGTQAHHVMAQDAAVDCRQQIVTVLTRLDSLVHEETRTTFTETRSTPAEQYLLVSSKNATVRRVPPDRSMVTLWKNDQLRLESIEIGNRRWNRWPGEGWKSELIASSGASGKPNEDAAARAAEAKKQLEAQIKNPICHGEVGHDGKRALQYSYELPLATVQLWADMATQAPIEERIVVELRGLNTKTTTKRTFSFDKSLTVVAPI